MSTTRLERKPWRIDLPSGSVPIEYTLMRRDTYNDDATKLLRPTYKVIVVDMANFVRLVELGPASFVVPSADKWDAKELESRTEFTTPYASDDPRGPGAVLMAVVGHHYRIERVKRAGCKFREPVRESKVFHASFPSGRRRTRFVEYGGATEMPLEVDHDSVNFYMDPYGLRIER